MKTFRRHTYRAPRWDYTSDKAYFVTINVKERIECLSKIINDTAILNQYGTIVRQQWLWLTCRYPYVMLDTFVVMPNHFHGIITIDKTTVVRAGRDLPLLHIKSLSELIGAFKTTSSKLIHLAELHDFAWQRSFHDRIIRDNLELCRIRRYIQNNPKNWDG